MHGSRGSWTLDGAIVGAAFVAPPAVLLTLEAPPWAAVLFVCGAAVGAVVGAALHAVTGALARRSIALVWVADLLAGAGCGACLLLAAAVGTNGTVCSLAALAWTSGFGAVALGPPWAVYTTIRVRQRRGLTAVVAGLVWVWVAWAPLLFLVLFTVS